MKKLAIALLTIFFLFSARAEISAEQAAMLETAASQITALHRKNYTVTMVSPELGKLLADQVTAQSARMGMPVQISIRHFILTNKDGQQNCQVALSETTPMKDALEPQANSLLASSGIGKRLSEAALASLNQAAELLLAGKNSFALLQDSPTACDFSAKQNLGSFAGIPVNSVKVRISKAGQSLSGFIVELQDQSRIRGTLQMQKHAETGMFLPGRLKLESNLGKAVGGITLPKVINAVFSEYKFQ